MESTPPDLNLAPNRMATATAAASAFAANAFAAISSNPLQTGMFIALAIMLAVIIWYIIFKVNQKQTEIASTYIITNNYMKPLNMLTNQAVDPMTMPLRNFYIKTAINCCCLGEWKNNYVDLAPLKSAIADGEQQTGGGCFNQTQFLLQGNIQFVAVFGCDGNGQKHIHDQITKRRRPPLYQSANQKQ
jgi:hypothetical protein